jgi:uncharacterized repeat protein (TIGR02543 family)
VAGPGSISCNVTTSPCVRDLNYGTAVPLTATPASGQRFVGWTQDCTGTALCQPVMTANHSVTATFKP